MEFTELEKEILHWLSQHSSDTQLHKQLELVGIKEREQTEDGIFIEFSFPKDSEIPPVHVNANPLKGPTIKTTSLKGDGQTLIFVADGRISVLEIFAKDESFPKELTNYHLVKETA